MSLIVHAPNVHHGGGRALLLPLLAADGGLRAIVDARLDVPATVPAGIIVARIAPTLAGRWHAERLLRSLSGSADRILCFGNLPPLLPVQGRILLYLQNRYLLAARDLAGFPSAARARIALERAWLRARIGAVHRVIVQSPSMAREVKAALGVEASVIPFAADAVAVARRADARPAGRRFDFVYAASGEPHKNHGVLVAAWIELAREDVRPALCLTLDPASEPDLCRRIGEEAARHSLNIELRQPAGPGEMRRLYAEAGALIYPSRFESLGLPLLEARQAGLGIVAAERDYVRDVVDPEESFDPESPVSIARAVRRYLGHAEPPPAVLSPAAFLAALAHE